MLCEKALPLLSEYFDDVLDPQTAIQISQHLGQCIRCRREFDGLSSVHKRLQALHRVAAPAYLNSLVRHKIEKRTWDSWRVRLREDIERRWSKIRTLEGMWYVIRLWGQSWHRCSSFLLPVPSPVPMNVMRRCAISIFLRYSHQVAVNPDEEAGDSNPGTDRLRGAMRPSVTFISPSSGKRFRAHPKTMIFRL